MVLAVQEYAKKAESITVGLSAVASVILSVSLSQVWGMINSQQLMLHAEMNSGLNFPANAATINDGLLEVAQFDPIEELVNTEENLDSQIYYMPE